MSDEEVTAASRSALADPGRSTQNERPAATRSRGVEHGMDAFLLGRPPNQHVSNRTKSPRVRETPHSTRRGPHQRLGMRNLLAHNVFRRRLAAVIAVSVVAAILVSSPPAGGQVLAGRLSGPYRLYRATLTGDQAVTRGDACMAGAFRLVLRRDGTYSAGIPRRPDERTSDSAAGAAPSLLRYGLAASPRCRASPGRHLRLVAERPEADPQAHQRGTLQRPTQTLTYPLWKRV